MIVAVTSAAGVSVLSFTNDQIVLVLVLWYIVVGTTDVTIPLFGSYNIVYMSKHVCCSRECRL